MTVEKERVRLNLRLRKIDADIKQALANLDDAAISDLLRDGLRIMLGIKTTKRVEVTDRPLVIPVTEQSPQSAPQTIQPQTIRSQPVVYRPNANRK